MARVLVTGGSGFIGSHAVIRLLDEGHHVRSTVRGPRGEAKARALVGSGGAGNDGRLSFVFADLGADEGWDEAARDCDYVLHVASPFPPSLPKHEDELIIPARDGALRVLKAARTAGVQRVVLTSSFAAIGYGHGPRTEPFDETSWTNLDGRAVTPYVKSKTLAERAAWDFVDKEGGGLELAVINPVAVLGPVLGPDSSTSILLVRRLLDGEMPGCPRLCFGVVDVRDVVDLHLRAMVDPSAKGERFLAVSGASMWIREMALALKSRMGPRAKRVPTRELPNWLVRLVSFVDPEVRSVLPELGQVKDATNRKARDVLGWEPISREDAVVATGESLAELGLVKRPG